jgi:hypothetical protein
MATLSTAHLDMVVSQQKYAQKALVAAVAGMKDIETNIMTLKRSIAVMNVKDSNHREKNPALPNKRTFMKGQVESLERLEEPHHPQAHGSQPSTSREHKGNRYLPRRNKTFREHCHECIKRTFFFVLVVLQKVVAKLTSIFTASIPPNCTALIYGDKRSYEACQNHAHSGGNNEISMLVDVVNRIDEKLASWLQLQQCQQENVNKRLTQEKKRSDS